MIVNSFEENTLEILITYEELIMHENAMVKRNLSDLQSECEKSMMKVTLLQQKLINYESISKKKIISSLKSRCKNKNCRINEETAEVESRKTKHTKLAIQ